MDVYFSPPSTYATYSPRSCVIESTGHHPTHLKQLNYNNKDNSNIRHGSWILHLLLMRPLLAVQKFKKETLVMRSQNEED